MAGNIPDPKDVLDWSVSYETLEGVVQDVAESIQNPGAKFLPGVVLESLGALDAFSRRLATAKNELSASEPPVRLGGLLREVAQDRGLSPDESEIPYDDDVGLQVVAETLVTILQRRAGFWPEGPPSSN